MHLKNKLFKGLTEHDILTWEEEKMRYQRRMGQKVTDLQFLRHLLMIGSRPVISNKEGVSEGYLTGHGPIYEKGDTLLEKYRHRSAAKGLIDFPDRKKSESSPECESGIYE
ncbi:MAG: hypothetical protein JW779_14295 [Candidatus Thorarchaeota archaeon]|nr:hypothetical protein [Candidatus Thorarchaeota archaeon]